MPELDEIIHRLEALESLMAGLERKKEIAEELRALLSIYYFRNIFSTMDNYWIFRAKEEEVAFKVFKRNPRGDLLPHFENLRYSRVNPQVFYVIYKSGRKKELAEIRIPKLYPAIPPNSIITKSRSLEVYTSHTHPEKCLGDIVKNRWDEKGRLGIAHWLLFVEVYLALRDRPLKV